MNNSIFREEWEKSKGAENIRNISVLIGYKQRVRHVGISVISCCYTQSPLWLTVKDHFPFYLHPFTAYFYMQRSDSKDHYMQLKLGDVLRIEIKNQDVLLQKNWGSHLW